MWRVYYEDGSVVGWRAGLDKLPEYGVMCILQKAVNYHIVFGCRYYAYVKGEWLPACENDLVDYIMHGKLISKLLVGRLTGNKRFNEVYAAAKHDKDSENL